MAESVISRFKTELHRNPAVLARVGGHWKGLDDLEVETCRWASWFNTERFHGELGDLTPAETEDAVAASKALMGSKSVHEAFEFQTDFAKSAFESYVAEMSKITELATATTKDVFAPFQGRVQAWLDTVQSVRAA